MTGEDDIKLEEVARGLEGLKIVDINYKLG